VKVTDLCNFRDVVNDLIDNSKPGEIFTGQDIIRKCRDAGYEDTNNAIYQHLYNYHKSVKYYNTRYWGTDENLELLRQKGGK